MRDEKDLGAKPWLVSLSSENSLWRARSNMLAKLFSFSFSPDLAAALPLALSGGNRREKENEKERRHSTASSSVRISRDLNRLISQSREGGWNDVVGSKASTTFQRRVWRANSHPLLTRAQESEWEWRCAAVLFIVISTQSHPDSTAISLKLKWSNVSSGSFPVT